jgi:transcriptional regulator with XRE-family HTH domain
MSENGTQTVTPMRERAAEEIRVLLARRRMSGSELARRIGQTQPYLSRRLTGEVALDVDDLERIAQALGVSITELLPSSGKVGGATLKYSQPAHRDRHHASSRERSGRASSGRPPSYPAKARRPIIPAVTAA